MVLNIALDENDSHLNKITITLEMAESIGLFFFACKISPNERWVPRKAGFDEDAFW